MIFLKLNNFKTTSCRGIISLASKLLGHVIGMDWFGYVF